MRIGVVKEIKPDERRVALTPVGAMLLTQEGHEVTVERGAGNGASFPDQDYRDAGAKLSAEAQPVWADSELLLKVKEPIASEYPYLRDGLTLFTYLHLAADRALTDALIASGATAIGYETIEDADGHLPLLTPMSEIAGRLAAQAGAWFAHSSNGGSGILIGGAPGVQAANVLVIGGGAVGANAATVAAGMGANVTILERSLARIRHLEEHFERRVEVLLSDPVTLRESLQRADIVIGAILIPGARATKVVTRADLAEMKPGAVIVDVAIDQGGCVETSRATTHAEPVYEVDGVLHYCVANMPGAVPVTSTRALTNATIGYIRMLARDPVRALSENPGFALGLNVRRGQILSAPVAAAFAENQQAAVK